MYIVLNILFCQLNFYKISYTVINFFNFFKFVLQLFVYCGIKNIS
jgi:hypothetical protein